MTTTKSEALQSQSQSAMKRVMKSGLYDDKSDKELLGIELDVAKALAGIHDASSKELAELDVQIKKELAEIEVDICSSRHSTSTRLVDTIKLKQRNSELDKISDARTLAGIDKDIHQEFTGIDLQIGRELAEIQLQLGKEFTGIDVEVGRQLSGIDQDAKNELADIDMQTIFKELGECCSSAPW